MGIAAITGGYYETNYYVNISIGNPYVFVRSSSPVHENHPERRRPQHFQMVIDTGFPDTWVAAPCDAFDCPTGIALYNSSKSSTAVNKTTSTGEIFLPHAVGNIFSDTFVVGSFMLTISFLTTGVDSPIPALAPASGGLGMGFPTTAATTDLPFWRAILEDSQISSPEFSIGLPRIGSPGAGALTFGGTNTSLYSGEIEYLNLADTNSTYWALRLSAMTVQNTSIGLSSGRLAVFDTAAGMILGPSDDVDAIWSSVLGASLNESAHLYQYPCDTDLNITVSFGGRVWPLNSSDINLGPTDPGSKKCFGAISAFGLANTLPDAGPDLDWIFGTPFLTNTYSVFRATPPSLGFAELSAEAGGSFLTSQFVLCPLTHFLLAQGPHLSRHPLPAHPQGPPPPPPPAPAALPVPTPKKQMPGPSQAA
ncbi:aspartic peptidase domain-containing protein [Mycena albidolilacea]|uniref:Aspartic peptidase domain-containing protein n=1 Tax=Mycena albidolilacea TaxID=1033008 RepID=A0AAD7EUP6_9AGAR|nr:aspartic peptidase domain-containing protein [Mycena albidolilacea]